MKPVILFACVHNGGGSLAAKVLAEHHGQGQVEVRSAGSEPGTGLNPAVVEVLHERGLSTKGEHPKLLNADDVRLADVVVTMGRGETCPVLPGKRYEDWPLDDPKGQDVETVRRIVGQVEQRVVALLAELARPPGTGLADPGLHGSSGRHQAVGTGVGVQVVTAVEAHHGEAQVGAQLDREG